MRQHFSHTIRLIWTIEKARKSSFSAHVADFIAKAYEEKIKKIAKIVLIQLKITPRTVLADASKYCNWVQNLRVIII